MTDKYIKLKDAIEAMYRVSEKCSWIAFHTEQKHALENTPAADVVEVVRCCNCKYGVLNGLEYLCTKHSGSEDELGEDSAYYEYHSSGWFCADGREKEAAEDV